MFLHVLCTKTVANYYLIAYFMTSKVDVTVSPETVTSSKIPYTLIFSLISLLP